MASISRRPFRQIFFSVPWYQQFANLKITIEIVDFPIKNGDFPLCNSLPEGITFIFVGIGPGSGLTHRHSNPSPVHHFPNIQIAITGALSPMIPNFFRPELYFYMKNRHVASPEKKNMPR